MLSENEEKWLILNSKIQKAKIVEAFRVFRSVGIEPILIKGYAIERFYPDYKQRVSFDIDLAVSSEDFAAAKELTQTDKLAKINIDLHNELRHLDTKNWKLLMQDSQEIEIDGNPVRVLSEEDHLRVICVHWLTDGGENKRKLWDVYYAVANRSPNFDWKKCFHEVSRTRVVWIQYTIGLAHIFLGLEIEDLPFKEQVKDLPNWLKRGVEKVWNRRHPFIPLDACYNDIKMFLYQIKLRFPPNPIMATIGVEGDFDKKNVRIYQMKYLFKRASPSIRSFVNFLRTPKIDDE